MPEYSSSALAAKQFNVISLGAGMERTNNWREAIKSQFGNKPANVPCGFFISLTDLEEIVNAYKDYKNNKGEPRPCVGARVYLTLPDPVAPGQSIPTDKISGILVPCYEDAITIGEEVKPIYRDIIVPVESNQAGAYSIYDVTQPCPPMCDPESPLR